MLKITKEVISKIKRAESLSSFISVVIDYEKEKEYADLTSEIYQNIECLSNDLTPRDISGIMDAVEPYVTELYIYTVDEVLSIFYPANEMLHSAIAWIDTKNRVKFLLSNGKLANNAYLNELLSNVNGNYIASPIELEYNLFKLTEKDYSRVVSDLNKSDSALAS